ncbi:hypothetical protein VTK73DRAFT_6429 [Phialemonium thermophilum]|uniref:Uncharacterized protein n=1 Tax=Phialemonium thermophilum TaxID=223376 RepID=A0ABR3UZI7_9PEZI
METASSPNTKNSAGYRHSAYEPLSRPYAFDDDDDDDEESANEVENSHHRCSGYYHYTAAAAAAAVPGQKGYEDSHDESDLGTASLHPNPLRSHPLSDVPLNDRRVSGGGGGGSQDTKNSSSSSSSSNGKNKNTHNPGRRLSRRPRQAEEARQRTSSIQPDVDFVAKPYGSLRAGTPPVTTVGSDRQVSSGNDYGAQHAQQHQQPQPQRVRIPSIFTSSFGRRAVRDGLLTVCLLLSRCRMYLLALGLRSDLSCRVMSDVVGYRGFCVLEVGLLPRRIVGMSRVVADASLVDVLDV